LSRWRIEACRLDRNGTFVDRVLLDDDGRGMMALPMTETVRLFAGPEDRSETPPLLLEPNFLADGRATELVVRDDLRRASYAIDAHAVAANGHAYVLMRLWRVDSGLGRPGRLSDIQAIEGSDSNKFILSAGGLLPGDYFIEYGSRGTPWKRSGPYRLGPGAELALGPFVLDEPAQVEVSASEPDSDTLLRATARRQGLRVQSPTLRGRVPSTLLFTAGDYELSVTLDAKSDRPRARTRQLHVAQDERLKLELEPKR
jgi:hypothetical protein